MLYSQIETAQGVVAVKDTQTGGFPLLFLHGNSTARDVFGGQFQSPLTDRHRVIALDLLGHGQSDDARDAETAYTIPGLADTVIEVIDALGIAHLAVVGWSLGGHVGIELLERDPRVSGLMIVGTPPISRGILGVLRGFQHHLDLMLTTRGRLSGREIDRFVRMCLGSHGTACHRALIARADWRMRRTLGRGLMAGLGVDQRQVVEHNPKPLAVVNGEMEPVTRLDYLESLHYANLWGGRCQVLKGAGHAPFLEQTRQFNTLVGRFAHDVASHAAHVAADGHRRHA